MLFHVFSPTSKTASKNDPKAPNSEAWSLLQFNALRIPVGLEDHIDSFNNFFVWISFAMDYDLMLKGFGSVNKHHMLLAKAIVPTAVPHRKVIRVFLERVC